MKNTIANLLVIFLMAVSLHGFGTNEHSLKAGVSEIAYVSDGIDRGEADRNEGINKAAICDICQVVHVYVFHDAIETPAPGARLAAFADFSHGPLQAVPDDILRPPTI